MIAELFHADGQTDEYEVANSRFSKFYESAENNMGQTISCIINCETSSQKSPISFEFRIHKIVKTAQHSTFLHWYFCLCLLIFLKQRLGYYLQVGQDLFLPHPPHVIILRNSNV
jgi:hypothetical protein